MSGQTRGCRICCGFNLMSMLCIMHDREVHEERIPGCVGNGESCCLVHGC